MSATLSRDGVEGFRELGFVAFLLVGALFVALGVAFLVIGISINTAPPAPYVSPRDKGLLIAGSALAVVAGLALVRLAGKVVGW